MGSFFSEAAFCDESACKEQKDTRGRQRQEEEDECPESGAMGGFCGDGVRVMLCV